MRAFLVGVLLALLPRACELLPRPPAAPSRGGVWVADRDGNALVRLGPALEVLARVEVAAPVRVEPLPDGGAWLASAPRGPGAAHRIVRISAAGRPRADLLVEGWRDFAPGLGEELFLLRRVGGGARLERRCGEVLIETGELPGPAVAMALGSGSLAFAFESGEILFLPRPGARGTGSAGAWHAVPGPVLGLAAAADGGWWVLDGGERLHRLDARLRTRATGATGLESPRLARGSGSGVWLFDRDQGSVARVDRLGRGWRSQGLPLAGVEAARRSGDGLLLAGGGAVLQLGPAGELRCGQGGLAFVADL